MEKIKANQNGGILDPSVEWNLDGLKLAFINFIEAKHRELDQALKKENLSDNLTAKIEEIEKEEESKYWDEAGDPKYDEYGDEVNEYGEALNSETAIERRAEEAKSKDDNYMNNEEAWEEECLGPSKNIDFYANLKKSFPRGQEFTEAVSKCDLAEEEPVYLAGEIKGFELALNLLSSIKKDERNK